MDTLIVSGSPLKGRLEPPADKAIAHRVILLGALSSSPVEITPLPSAQDCQRTIELIEALGVCVSRTSESLRIDGVGLHGLKEPHSLLNCGESGTTMRLACGLLAGQPFQSKLGADPSLSTRPMRRIAQPLGLMGAQIMGSSSSEEIYPPLSVKGRRPLNGISYVMPVASAQVKSAILLAGLFADGQTNITELVKTRDHTEKLLEYVGVTIQENGLEITLTPADKIEFPSSKISLPGDFSSAAFFIVAACICPGSRIKIENVSLNPTRTHLLNVLKRMGASIDIEVNEESWERSGEIEVSHSQLLATAVSSDEAAYLIDELPILMVAAAAAKGQTVFEGLSELKVKETDRLRSMTEGLKKMGAYIEIKGEEGLVISGGILKGAQVESFGDHRTAMSLAVAGLFAQGKTLIKNSGCVSKSFGNFFKILSELNSPETVKIIDNT